MSNELEKSEFLLYSSDNGDIKIDVFLQDENIWLTQKRMSELFGTSTDNIGLHLKNIYADEELKESSTTEDFSVVQNEGARSVRRTVKFYNLDVIIAVGYRVNSKRATQFRIWATRQLKEFIIKGYVMDVERLKNPNPEFGKDYFDEQLEKIRDIRSSERRFYQKITDIYSQCSIDYDKNSQITKDFFATVQNKLHFSITGNTAAEIVKIRADHQKQNMGLTNWKNSPKGKIRKEDVSIAKNYLDEKELKSLNRIVTMYLDYAESQAENKIAMNMQDWIKKLDAFLQFNEKDILQNSGKVSAEIAKNFAESEFGKLKKIQDLNYESDFDKSLNNLLEISKANKS
ncbi:virulence RhuM family protein [Flavobacteriaceae bacterium]|nr:virulence RhuM family protein [Flavobacteriaceae bacterium]